MHMLQSFIMRSCHLLSKDVPHSEHGVQLLTSFSVLWFNPRCSVCGPQPCVTDHSSAPCTKAELLDHERAFYATCSMNMWVPNWGAPCTINKLVASFMAHPHLQSTAPIDSLLSSADGAWPLIFGRQRRQERTITDHPPKNTVGVVWEAFLRSNEAKERLDSSHLRTAFSCPSHSMILSHALYFFFSNCARSGRQQLFSLCNALPLPGTIHLHIAWDEDPGEQWLCL